MPSQLTYPGVYIEEPSSGVRTISGVATSIAAFVGWAPQGPTDRAVRILSFSDYTRAFGEIHPRSYLGYSVRQFFDNGGGDAYVVRIADAKDEKAKCDCGEQGFEASGVGNWARFFGVTVKVRGSRFSVSVVRFATDASGQPITSESDLPKAPASVVEVFSNLSSDPDDPRYAPEIINDEIRGSGIVRMTTCKAPTEEGPVPFTTVSETVPDDADDISNGQWNLLVQAAADAEKVLDRIDLFNLLCVPGMTDKSTLEKLTKFCNQRRAFLIADCERDSQVKSFEGGPGLNGFRSNGALYYPWIKAPDPLAEGRISEFPPCGFMAGLFARTDASRGVWKAPAGTEATLVGVTGPQTRLTDKENGLLNIKGVNCIRTLPVYGTVSWGARTLDGDDEIGSEWKYIPIRRTALFIEESLYRGTQWAVFEPNDEPLWAQLRLNIGAFMHDLYRQGAFQGRTPREAYFVKCDKETTTQNDINRGIVNVVVGFSPLKPAEFVVIKLKQIAGQIDA